MKALRIINSFARSLLFSLVVMAGLMFTGNPVVAGVGGSIVMITSGLPGPSGVLMAGLNREVWLQQIMEMYTQSFDWMDLLDDLSEFVEFNTINIADAGVDPEVLLNNTTYPIDINERADQNYDIPLDYFDTENTVVRNARKMELSYDKMASVLRGHTRALKRFGGKRASHAIAPQEDTEKTPVIPTTGGDNGNAIRLITEADILKLAARFDAIDAPEDQRVLVLHPTHFQELVANSDTLKKQRERAPEGTLNRAAFELYGFRIEKFRNGAVYDHTTGEKKAFGAAAGGNDTIASFAFIQGEVMKAIGDYDMFERLADPEARGDIVGFQQRFVAMPKRNQYIGAIYADSTV